MTSIKHRTAALLLAALIAATGALATSAFAADSAYAVESGDTGDGSLVVHLDQVVL